MRPIAERERRLPEACDPLERIARERAPYDARDRARRSLQERKDALVTDVGLFRSLDYRDAVRVHFDGNAVAAARGVGAMIRRGLLEEHRSRDPRDAGIRVLTATPTGAALARWLAPVRGYAADQQTWAGMGKVREMAHDTAVYRAAQAEARRLAAAGARILRIRLDAELQQVVARREAAARARTGLAAAAAARQQAALDLALTVTPDGQVVYPDVQLEYEAAAGRTGHVSIEVASEHYRSRAIACKANAGCRIYATNARAAATVRRTLATLDGSGRGGRTAAAVFEL